MKAISFLAATDNDYEWTFQLKKAAEKRYIEAVFGWDEPLQREFHAKEWAEDKPTLIRFEGVKVGTYLLRKTEDGYYFARFFILPGFQRRGIGSHVLSLMTNQLDREVAACRLGYLQGNRVGGLYEGFGFVTYAEDKAFVYMRRAAIHTD